MSISNLSSTTPTAEAYHNDILVLSTGIGGGVTATADVRLYRNGKVCTISLASWSDTTAGTGGYKFSLPANALTNLGMISTNAQELSPAEIDDTDTATVRLSIDFSDDTGAGTLIQILNAAVVAGTFVVTTKFEFFAAQLTYTST